MRNKSQIVQDSTAETIDTSTPNIILGSPIEGDNPNKFPLGEHRLVTVAKDFYKAAGKDLTEERAEEISEFYQGDYETMLNDMYKAAGKTLSEGRLMQLEKHYKLVEDVVQPELEKGVLDFQNKVDDIEKDLHGAKTTPLSAGAESSRMPIPEGLEEVKEQAIKQYEEDKDEVINNFDFTPLKLREVVNSVGKGEDDMDEVSQQSKVFLEKYTQRMTNWVENYEKTFSPTMKEVATLAKSGQDFDPNTLEESDAAQYKEWVRRQEILKKQEELNNSTIYKKNELKRGLNNVARNAKDNNESVKDAIVKYMTEQGVITKGVEELSETEGISAHDTQGSVAVYNAGQRVQSSIKYIWRGITEAIDSVIEGEESTTYNRNFKKQFDNFLLDELDEDIKRLMWGTNKSKYEGDIFEKTVEVNGHKIMLDEKDEPVGVRKKDGNMTWVFNDSQIDAVKEYKQNKDKYKEEAYHRVNLGSASAKTLQIGTDMLPIVATTVATQGVGLPAYMGTFAGTFAVTYGNAYESQFEKTGDVGNATAYASVVSSATAMLEGLGGVEGSIINKVNKKTLWRSIDETASELASKNVLDGAAVYKSLGKHLVKNGLEETAIEISQSVAEAGTQLMFNQETDLSVKELIEIAVLTPIATGPISLAFNSSDFAKFGIENLKVAAKNKEVFNKVADEWVNSADTEAKREARQEKVDIKKSLINELSESYTAMDELGAFNPELASNILDKTVEIVKKKEQITKAKSDMAKGQYEQDLAEMRSELNDMLREGYQRKSVLDDRIKQSELENRNREREKEIRRQKSELDKAKNDSELVGLNIVPDNASPSQFKSPIPDAASFEAQYEEEYDEFSTSEGLTVKMNRVEGSVEEAEGVLHGEDGKVVGQFTAYTNTPVDGTIEMAASLEPEVQKKGITTDVYQKVANQSGKPIIPGSVSRDFSEKKSGSTFSTNAAYFWKKMLDKGIAEEVEITTKDGKVIRTIAVLPEGFTSTDTVKKIEDAAVEESNVESEKFEQEEEVQIDLDGGTITLNRNDTPIQYKVEKYNTNKEGDIVSVTVTDPRGNRKTIRSKSVVAEIQTAKLAKDNEITNIESDELEKAITDSGAREDGRVSTDRATENNETVSEEQKFGEGTRADIVGENVNYQGVNGKLVQFEDGGYNVVTPDGQTVFVESGESQSTNADLGITKGQTNLEVVNQQLSEKQEERAEIRRELMGLFREIDPKIPANAKGDFVEALNNMGGENPVAVASAFQKALKHRVGKLIRDAIGSDVINKAKKLARRLEVLNKELSTKNIRRKRKSARIKDYAKEAKQLKAERKAKAKAARKRSEGKTEQPKKKSPNKTKPVESTIQEEKAAPKSENKDTIPDEVYNAYVDTGFVPDEVLNTIADHWVDGTQSTMSPRQKEIAANFTKEINIILVNRAAEGSYKKKSGRKAVEDKISVIEERNHQIADTLRKLKMSEEKIAATIQVFGNVAKRWAKRNRRPIQDFYSEIFVGIEVKDLGEGSRGRTVHLDGSYIIQLSHEATIAEPVHELAHIFQNFLTAQEKQQVLDWANSNSWDRDVSEMFARGFEQWLQRTNETADLDAFKKFKQWLRDIYDGIVTYKGTALPTFSPALKKIYTDLAMHDVPAQTEETYTEASKGLKKTFDDIRKYGMQFKKATFDKVLGKVEVEARGFNKFMYLPMKMKKLAKLAVANGYTDPVNASSYAAKVLSEYQDNPDFLPTMSPDQFIGYGYALTEMERIYQETAEMLKKSPNDSRLMDLKTDLEIQIHDLAQVLSVARSVSGLMLGLGSKIFRRSMFDADNLKRSAQEAINRGEVGNKGRDLTESEKRHIDKYSKYMKALLKERDELSQESAEDVIKQMRAAVDELIASGFTTSPTMDKAINKAKKMTPRQRSSKLEQDIKDLRKLMEDNPDILMSEDLDSKDKQIFRKLRSVISVLVASDPTIDGLIPLTNALQDFFPDINQDKLLNVLVWSDKSHQKSQADRVASSIQSIKRESRLLDQLRTYLTETYEEVEKTGNKTRYPERLVRLEKFIINLKALSATDYTIDNEAWMEAVGHLDALQTIYADLTLEKVDLNSPKLEDMINRVRDYETARKISKKEKQLKELESTLEELRNGTYEGNLNDLLPQKTNKFVDERLKQIADKIGVTKEAIKSFKEKSDILEIVNTLSKILQRIDGGEQLKSFEDLYNKVKEELPDITERQLYDALLYKKTPKEVNEKLKKARKLMNDEVNGLNKLENFLKKTSTRSKKKIVERNKLQTELEELLDGVEKVAKARYIEDGKTDLIGVSDFRLEELKKDFRDILDSYEGILSGEITTMTIEDLIKKVSKIKQQELNEKLLAQKGSAIMKTLKTYSSVGLENNIFELVPELLPKMLREDNKILKRQVSDEVKQERLIRVKRMFEIVKGKLDEEGGNVDEFKKNNPTEYAAIVNFLNIEKKSQDRKPELIRLNREIYMTRAAYKDWLDDKYQATTLGRWKSIVNTPRLLVLAGDISFVTYQGGNMLFAHPRLALGAFKNMTSAAFNHKNWQKQMADIQLDPMYAIAISSGLKLVDEMSLTLEEELQLTSILEKIPWGVGRASKEFRRFGERLYSSYMNTLRMSAFKAGMLAVQEIQGIPATASSKLVHTDDKAYAVDETFPPEYIEIAKGIAEHVNMHTGSASTFTGVEQVDEGINATLNSTSGIFIAPRLYASVFRSTAAMVGGTPTDFVKSVGRDVKKDPMAAFYRYRFNSNLKKLAALGGYHLVLLSLYATSSGFFDDEEDRKAFIQTTLNPYNSSFLKAKAGQRVFSISPFVSYYRYMARMLGQLFGGLEGTFDRSKAMEKKTGFWDHTSDFLKYRLNPFVGAAEAGFLNRDWDGSKITEHSLNSEDWYLALGDRAGALAKRSIVPIWGQGLIDNIYDKTHWTEAIGEMSIDFAGVNSYTVSPYQDVKVKRYLDNKKFKLSYTGVPNTKKYDQYDEQIKTEIKREFGRWLQDQLSDNKKPTYGRMRAKNKQITRQVISIYR